MSSEKRPEESNEPQPGAPNGSAPPPSADPPAASPTLEKAAPDRSAAEPNSAGDADAPAESAHSAETSDAQEEPTMAMKDAPNSDIHSDAPPSHAAGSQDIFVEDEDDRLDDLPEQPTRPFPIKLLLIGVGLFAIALLWYWSSVRHDHFYLSIDGDRVTARRGLYFPVGSTTYAPTPGYKPFTLPTGVAPEHLGPMDHDELDRVLRNLYLLIARTELKDLEKGNPERAEDMLRRALKLSHSSPSEDESIMAMHGDVAFHQGLKKLRGVHEQLDEALAQFRNAAARGGSAYRNAELWVKAIEQQRESFRKLADKTGLDPDKVLFGRTLKEATPLEEPIEVEPPSEGTPPPKAEGAKP